MATTKAAKKSGAEKKSTRKYGPKAGQSVEREMKAFKAGKLKSGSGQKVTNPKQAIAIGLSEARASGAKAPEPPPKKAAKKKKSATRKSTAKKSPARKTAKRRTSRKKAA